MDAGSWLHVPWSHPQPRHELPGILKAVEILYLGNQLACRHLAHSGNGGYPLNIGFPKTAHNRFKPVFCIGNGNLHLGDRRLAQLLCVVLQVLLLKCMEIVRLSGDLLPQKFKSYKGSLRDEVKQRTLPQRRVRLSARGRTRTLGKRSNAPQLHG